MGDVGINGGDGEVHRSSPVDLFATGVWHALWQLLDGNPQFRNFAALTDRHHPQPARLVPLIQTRLLNLTATYPHTVKPTTTITRFSILLKHWSLLELHSFLLTFPHVAVFPNDQGQL